MNALRKRFADTKEEKTMIKRLISLMLIVMMALAIAIPVAVAEDDTPDPRAGYYYVKTGNGRGLNVRESPNGTVVGSLKYGTKIYVTTFTTPEWALITYVYDKPGYGTAEYAAWVSTRYLTRSNPGKYVPESASASTSASTSTATQTEANSLAALNAIFATAKQVSAPYTVVARPSRASGWVNLRWAPSTDAERIATCPQGKQLTVLAELKGWYQVQDPMTGMIGFIMSKYVAKQ